LVGAATLAAMMFMAAACAADPMIGGNGSDGPDGSVPAGPSCRPGTDCPAGTFCSATSVCIAEGTCAADSDCEEGHVCNLATAACEIGSDCGASAFVAEAVPPNMLVVLDRSCSMKREVSGVPKWTSAVDALVDLTTVHRDQVRWGLSLFPDLEGGSCGQDDIAVPTGPSNEGTIQEMLTGALDTADPLYPSGPCVTNIDTAMEQAGTDPALDDTERSSFVMLVSDGAQSASCRGGSDARTFTAIDELADRGIPTYVVGFGDRVDEDALSEFASRGGTARMATPEYYQADDAAALASTFDEIVRGVVSCEYRLDRAPEDLSRVYVFLDDTTAVARDTDHAEGWDYNGRRQSVVFYGAPCEALREGTATDVDIVFGCAGPVLE